MLYAKCIPGKYIGDKDMFIGIQNQYSEYTVTSLFCMLAA